MRRSVHKRRYKTQNGGNIEKVKGSRCEHEQIRIEL